MSFAPHQAEALAKWAVKTVELVVCRGVLTEQARQVAVLISSHGVGARHPTDHHWNTELLLFYGEEIERLDQELAIVRFCGEEIAHLVDSVNARCP